MAVNGTNCRSLVRKSLVILSAILSLLLVSPAISLAVEYGYDSETQTVWYRVYDESSSDWIQGETVIGDRIIFGLTGDDTIVSWGTDRDDDDTRVYFATFDWSKDRWVDGFYTLGSRTLGTIHAGDHGAAWGSADSLLGSSFRVYHTIYDSAAGQFVTGHSNDYSPSSGAVINEFTFSHNGGSCRLAYGGTVTKYFFEYSFENRSWLPSIEYGYDSETNNVWYRVYNEITSSWVDGQTSLDERNIFGLISDGRIVTWGTDRDSENTRVYFASYDRDRGDWVEGYYILGSRSLGTIHAGAGIASWGSANSLFGATDFRVYHTIYDSEIGEFITGFSQDFSPSAGVIIDEFEFFDVGGSCRLQYGSTTERYFFQYSSLNERWVSEFGNVSGDIWGSYGNRVCIALYEATISNTCDMGNWAAGTSLTSGSDYSLQVPAGNYILHVDPFCGSNNNNLLAEYWTSDDVGTIDCREADLITVRDESDIDADLRLDNEAAFITGRVTDGNGVGIPDFRVQVSGPDCDIQFGYEVDTDASGQYSIPVPGGTEYKVGTCYSCNEFIQDIWVDEYWDNNDGVSQCHMAETVTPTSSNPSVANFSMEAGARISGTVTGDENPCITAYRVNNNDTCDMNEWAGGSSPNQQGNYFFSVPPGDYFLHFDPACGYVSSSVLPEYWTTDHQGTMDCSQADQITVSVGDQITSNIALDNPASLITGEVLDTNGDPVVGLVVQTSDPDCNQQYSYQGITDENGEYSISVSGGSEYKVGTCYECSGTINGIWVDEFWDNNGGTSQCDMAGTVTPTLSTPATADFVMEAGARISGTVTGADNPCITAYAVIEGDTCNHDEWAGGAGPDQDGNFSFTVPAGDYFLHFEPSCGSNPDLVLPEYWTDNHEGTENCGDAGQLSLQAGDDVTSNIVLDTEAAIITGNIIDENGDPVVGLMVEAQFHGCGTESQLYQGSTNNDGEYTIPVPGGENYQVSTCYYCDTSMVTQVWLDEIWNNSGGTQDCNEAGVIAAEVGNPQRADFELAMGVEISGSVSGLGGAGACVMAYSLIDNDTCNQDGYASEGAPDENGDYAFVIPEGTYFIQADPSCDSNPNSVLAEYWTSDHQGTTECDQAETLTVEVGDSPVVNIALDTQGATISGTIFQADGESPIVDENMWVNVFSGSNPCSAQNVGWADVDSQGGYSITVPAGQYYLRVDGDETTPYTREYWTGGGSQIDCQGAETVTAIAGEDTDEINFQLDIAGTISGMVFQNDGVTPVTGEDMWISVFTGSDPCNTQHVIGTGLNQDGTYTVWGVPAGTDYYIQTGSDAGYYLHEYWASGGSVVDCSGAGSLTVIAGEDTPGNNFQLELGGKVTGYVYEDGNNTPLTDESWVRVDVYTGNPCDYDFAGGGEVNLSDGSYLTSALPLGDVYLKVNHAGFHPNSWWTSTGISNDCNLASPVNIAAERISNADFILPKDSNGDGLTDLEEQAYGLDPMDIDSDDDGLKDVDEVWLFNDIYGVSWDDDADGDTILNLHETDMDNDGVSDLQELARGSDATDDGSVPPELDLYDDFSSKYLSSDNWETNQFIRETVDGTLLLGVEASSLKRNYVQLLEAPGAGSVKTWVTLQPGAEISSDGEYRSGIGGSYYNSVASGNREGEISVSLYIGDTGAGLEAWYDAYQSDDSEADSWTELARQPIALNQSLQIDQTYCVEILYNNDNLFTFNVYAVNTSNSEETLIGSESYSGPAYEELNHQVRYLKSRAENGMMTAAFDNVQTGSPYVMYDDFQAMLLDQVKWDQLEYTVQVTGGGMARLVSHSEGARARTNLNFKKHYPYVEAVVVIDDESWITAERGRSQLTGLFFNEERGPGSGLRYNGNEQDVSAAVNIAKRGSDAVPSAYCWMDRSLDSSYSTYQDILYESFYDLPEIQKSRRYKFFIGFVGNLAVLGVEDLENTPSTVISAGVHTIPSTRYLPSDLWTALRSRVDSSGGQGIHITLFDDVLVGGTPYDPAPGDVNVDGNVDLLDLMMSMQVMTGNQNVDVWTHGDANGDGKINLQDVHGIVEQMTAP